MMILQFTLIGFVVFGDQLFAALGMQAPGFYADIRDKKLVFGMGAWFLGNMVQSSLNSTGAFEIFFSGSKVKRKNFQHASVHPRSCPQHICAVLLSAWNQCILCLFVYSQKAISAVCILQVFSKLVTEQMPILTDVFDSIQAIM